MSHREQRQFCKSVRRKYPSFFSGCNVVDVGSLDINGNNKYLFHRCGYMGIDIVPGKNVNRVGVAKDVLKDLNDTYEYSYHGLIQVDTIISTEMLEHDATWKESLKAMYDLLRPGGLLLITAAGDGRREHGTHQHSPTDSPGTNGYYCNVSNQMFASVLPATLFTTYYLNQDPRKFDMQFFGIKKSLR
jgi:SAM-dependent methyltransferase